MKVKTHWTKYLLQYYIFVIFHMFVNFCFILNYVYTDICISSQRLRVHCTLYTAVRSIYIKTLQTAQNTCSFKKKKMLLFSLMVFCFLANNFTHIIYYIHKLLFTLTLRPEKKKTENSLLFVCVHLHKVLFSFSRGEYTLTKIITYAIVCYKIFAKLIWQQINNKL